MMGSEFSFFIGATWVGTRVRYVQYTVLYIYIEQIHFIDKELHAEAEFMNV
jgi:hypothetical protein